MTSENVFNLINELTQIESERKKEEWVKEHLQPADFTYNDYEMRMNGYRIYGMIEDLVVFQCDGTWMLRNRDEFVTEMCEDY